MSDADPAPTRPAACRRHTWLPGLVWAIPLAALIVVGYVGLRALAMRGILVTVTFERAAGASPGNTKVVYQGVDIGTLVELKPNADQRRIDMTLRLDPRAKQSLTSNARFWLIGANPSLSDLSSLKAAVEGVAIGFAPGEGGRPERHFVGLEKAPTVLPGDRGTRYVLSAHALDTVREGSELLFRGLPIGKVTSVKFDQALGFRVEVFVYKPYDALIRATDLFWVSSPLTLNFSGGSIEADLAPLSTIFAGGIELQMPTSALSLPQSAANTSFELYPTEPAARQALSGPALRYEVDLHEAAGDLAVGAPVTLLGFRIGEVLSTHLAYAPRTHAPFTAVTVLLYPERLGLERAPADPRAAGDAEVNELLRLGFRARLQQTPALVGARSIALEATRTTRATHGDRLVYGGTDPRIPAAPGASDLDDIASQADQILAKVNRVPIEAIGRQADGTTRALSHASSELDAALGEVRPQLGPLLIQLNQAAAQLTATTTAAQRLMSGEGAEQGASLPDAIGQLSDAARSIRTLADYLERHPEALLRGKRPGS